ncbi:SDR family NAD(P)-dependent oxidoreductase [Streptomyces sp. NPDC046805]|uniref:SDR family NAD(P)-dependent oxidoreductase n=1 Tax=Streptomyces sp. NPDC046805 TaxID=3155134 RepID=UPI0033CED409
MDLSGKVAVVTGGGGVGCGVSLDLAARGAKVVVNDLVLGDVKLTAENVVAEIRAAGGEAVADGNNVATFDSSTKIIGTAIEKFGRIDFLVMYAGNFVADSVADLTEERWHNSLAVHLTGPMGCAKAAVQHMTKQGDGGRIITVASRAAFLAPIPAYAAATAGIMGLTSALAAGLAPAGITANRLIPSATTQLFPGQDANARTMGMLASITLGPDYIALVVTYLVSDQAGEVTGRFVHASGGDICIYAEPLGLHGGTNSIVRNNGK